MRLGRKAGTRIWRALWCVYPNSTGRLPKSKVLQGEKWHDQKCPKTVQEAQSHGHLLNSCSPPSSLPMGPKLTIMVVPHFGAGQAHPQGVNCDWCEAMPFPLPLSGLGKTKLHGSGQETWQAVCRKVSANTSLLSQKGHWTGTSLGSASMGGSVWRWRLRYCSQMLPISEPLDPWRKADF